MVICSFSPINYGNTYRKFLFKKQSHKKVIIVISPWKLSHLEVVELVDHLEGVLELLQLVALDDALEVCLHGHHRPVHIPRMQHVVADQPHERRHEGCVAAATGWGI